MYKLYNDIGVRYPLPVTSVDISGASNVLSANLQVLNKVLKGSSSAVSNAVTEAVDKQADKDPSKKEGNSSVKRDKLSTIDDALKQIDESDDDGAMSDEENVDIAGPLKAALESMDHARETSIGTNQTMTLDDEASKRKRLFAGLTFFISREVPKGYLELIALSYGGKVGWEGNDSPISVKDPSITHHIIDRPKLPAAFEDLPKSREYVQPQWLLDSANYNFLLPTSRYAIGAELPPHLSPWVDDEEEGYKPAYAEEIECLKNGQVYNALARDEAMAEDEGAAELDSKKSESDHEEEEDTTSGDEIVEEDDEDSQEEEEENEEKLEEKRVRRLQKEVSFIHWFG